MSSEAGVAERAAKSDEAAHFQPSPGQKDSSDRSFPSWYIGGRLIGRQGEQQAVRHDVQPCIMSYLPH